MLELRHVGIVVSDLDDAMGELSTTMGLEWAAPRPSQNGGRVVKSAGLTPQLELIEGKAEGTDPGFVGVQHISVWTPDLPGLAQRLLDGGAVPVTKIEGPVPTEGNILFRMRTGILVEASTRNS